MKRQWIALALVLALTVGTALAAGAGYSDVPHDAWFAAAVEEVTEKGLMSGSGDGTFRPNEAVTRAMVITVLWQLEGSPAQSDLSSFSDIDPAGSGMWYAPQAAWAKNAGVASGYADGSFHGGEAVTREQLAAFLYRYAVYKDQPIAQGALGLFSDAGLVSSWAQDPVRHMVGMGYFRGDSEGRLDPLGTADRAELASILCRMLTPAVG